NRACERFGSRQLVHLRHVKGGLVAQDRQCNGCDARRRHHGVVARASLFDWLYGRRSLAAAFLRLSLAVHLRHADAGDGRQSGPAVFRLGGGWPASYLLIGFWYE